MIKNSISKQGNNIRKGFKKTNIYMRYEPEKCPFLSHNFPKHIGGGMVLIVENQQGNVTRGIGCMALVKKH